MLKAQNKEHADALKEAKRLCTDFTLIAEMLSVFLRY